MNRIKLTALSLVAFLAPVAFAQDVFITVDQFGYRPDAKKVAVLRSPEVGYDAYRRPVRVPPRRKEGRRAA